jgi:1,4-alpha-glucan branching enzyme
MAQGWQADEDDVDAVLAARQSDPFAVLGPHQTPAGWAIRAFVPFADKVSAVTRDGVTIVALERRKGDFFEGLAEGLKERPAYRLEARNGRGAWSYDDGYAFGPALGPLDDYLLL